MGRWNDRPDDSPDDWRGWKGGKYDGRYRGVNKSRSYRHRNKTKSLTVGIIFCLIIGIFGFILWNQGYLDSTIEQSPQVIQDASKTAKDMTTDTTEKLSKTVNEQLENPSVKSAEKTFDDISDTIQKTSETIPVKDISEIPKIIQESNPINKKPEIDIKELEKQIHELTNQYRTQNGLKVLSMDDKLSRVAENHSNDMASRDYFDHDSPEGKDPTDRAKSQGYQCQKGVGNLIYNGIAENIFQNNSYDSVTIIGVVPIYDWNSLDELAHSTVDGWMNSSGHRQNILSSIYDREGIGIAIASDNKVYITQDFC